MSVRSATSRLGVLLALCAEAMFFLGIFGAVLVLQRGGETVDSPRDVRGGICLLIAAATALMASGPLSRARVRVISSEENRSVIRNPPHPHPVPEGHGTRTTFLVACSVVLLAGVLFLIDQRPALHWPADASPLPAAAAVVSYALAVHVLVSLLFTVGQLFHARRFSLAPLWLFAGGIWAAKQLLLR